MFEGVPGSGKSYYAVAERLLKWVRAGRRIYAYVDGFHTDRLALFEGRAPADLDKQITIWATADEVRAGLPLVEPGSAVLIDEVQTVFRSKEKTDPALLRWLETHRHRGIDIVLMCQQYGQVTLGVNRLIEATTKFRRLDRFGLKNRYQASVRGNPEETEVIRMFSGKYEPKVYAYYSSYSSAGIRETRRSGSIMKSPTLIIGMAGLVGAVVWFGTGRWLTPSSDVEARNRTQLTALEPRSVSLPPAVSPAALQQAAAATNHQPEIVPIEVQGGMLSESGQWLYVTKKGRILTDEQIAQLSGGIVNARMDRGSRILYGSGVIWGGEPALDDRPLPSVQALTQGASISVAKEETRHHEADRQAQEAVVTGLPLESPEGILATPKVH